MRRFNPLITGSWASSSGLGGLAAVTGSEGGRVLSSLGILLSALSGTTAAENEKSTAIEEDSQGTCSPFEARVTPACAFRKDCSALTPGVRISLSSSVTNRLWSFLLSLSTAPSAVEYNTNVLFGVTAGANPAQ